MTPEAINHAAETLFEAEQSGRQCGLVSLANPGMTLDDALCGSGGIYRQEEGSGT